MVKDSQLLKTFTSLFIHTQHLNQWFTTTTKQQQLLCLNNANIVQKQQCLSMTVWSIYWGRQHWPSCWSQCHNGRTFCHIVSESFKMNLRQRLCMWHDVTLLTCCITWHVNATPLVLIDEENFTWDLYSVGSGLSTHPCWNLKGTLDTPDTKLLLFSLFLHSG